MQQPEIKLYDVYDMWYESVLQQWWFKIALFVFALIFLSVIIWVLKRIFYKKKLLLPWQRALQEFKKLQTPALMNVERSQEFYLQVSRILKQYLQDRYGMPLLDKTDHELVEFFQQHNVLRAFTQDIEQVLEGAVRIKFAKQAAVQDAMRHDLAVCAEVVEKTIPVRPERRPNGP